MIINAEKISKLNPCESRFNNYLRYYKDFEGSLEEFLALDKIAYNDKVWIFTRLATKEQNIKWAVACARSVLDIFESKYPGDKSPRKALDATLDYMGGKISLGELLEAGRSANAAAAAAAAAAYANAYAAANAACAAYAYAAYDAYAPANAAINAARAASNAARGVGGATNRKQQYELNSLFMLEAIR